MKSERASSSKRVSGLQDRRSVDPEFCDLRSSPAPESVRVEARIPSKKGGHELPPAASAEFEDVWRTLFAGRTPREVLARIVRGEKLSLRARVSRRLVERALLLDGERCHLRSLAHVARASSAYRGQPDFGSWLDSCVDRAIDDLLRGELQRGGGAKEEADAWSALARPLNLDPARARSCCLNFDARPFEERFAFFELVLLHRSLDEVAESAHCSPTTVAKRARCALLALLEPLRVHGSGLSNSDRSSTEESS